MYISTHQSLKGAQYSSIFDIEEVAPREYKEEIKCGVLIASQGLKKVYIEKDYFVAKEYLRHNKQWWKGSDWLERVGNFGGVQSSCTAITNGEITNLGKAFRNYILEA